MQWLKSRRFRRNAGITGVIFPVAFATVAWQVGDNLIAPANRTVGPPPGGLSINAMLDAATGTSQLIIFHGAEHEDLLDFDPARYEKHIVGFLNKCL